MYHCPAHGHRYVVALCVALLAIVGACGPNLPRCNEDEVLVGRGEFDNGRWSTYDCGPALDDMKETHGN